MLSASGPFDKDIGYVEDKYTLEMVTNEWLTFIWAFVFVWQGAWIVYILSTICRQVNGSYLYLFPVFRMRFLLLFITGCLVAIGWLFAWTRENIAVGLPLSFVSTVLIFRCLHASFESLDLCMDLMVKNGLKADVWIIQLLIQNGVAFLSIWIGYIFLINLDTVLVYGDGDQTGMDMTDADTIILAIIAVDRITWFASDVIFAHSYTRYLLSPYVAKNLLLFALLEGSFDLDERRRNSIFTLALFILTMIFTVIKLYTLIHRHKKHPIQPLQTRSVDK